MNIEVIIKSKIPEEQINKFEDSVVYNTAVATREYVKGKSGYPYLSGRLSQTEISAPIIGYNKNYGLTAGVEYAKKVWNYTNVKWTNPSTMPQWYFTAFKYGGDTIIANAIDKSLKEIK